MSDDIASAQFAGYFRRWQEIEDGKQSLSDESKDLFADMKSDGYDSKATRAVFRDKRKELNADPAAVQEEEAIYAIYMDALNRGMSKAPARLAPAHVENKEKFGLISSQERTVTPRHEPTDYAEQSGDKSSATNSQIVPTSPRQVDVSGPLVNSSLAAREDGASAVINPHSSVSPLQTNTAGAVETPPTAPAPHANTLRPASEAA